MFRFAIGATVAVSLLTLVVVGIAGWDRLTRGIRLLNVSYDPTRELWEEMNRAFAAHHEQTTGERLSLRTSHGGSTSQARAVIDGLEADVVSLALWADVDSLRGRGLVRPGWEERYPPPYYSTVVFVVRKGNPRNIRDWPDLLAPGVQVVTPNPKTSGNGRLTLLAAWGAVLTSPGGTEARARDYVRALYRQVPVLDTGARNATLTFTQKKIGDVQITWENEAYLQLKEFPGELEIVTPSRSLRAEPPMAVVDRVVDRKGTRARAEAYLAFVASEAGQEIIARHHYRPADARVWARHAENFGTMTLFSITDIVPGGWAEAQEKFFSADGEYERLERTRDEPLP